MMPNDTFWIINELCFASLILFGSRESEYTAKGSSSLTVPLLLFIHAAFEFKETSAEGFFTYYACCSKQRILRYFVKSELNLSEKGFLWDCGICEGKSTFGWKRTLLFHIGCSPGSQGELWVTVTLCCDRDSYGSLRIGPFLCHSDSLVFYSDSFISFSLLCLSPSTVFHKLRVSVYGGKFSWCETWSNL